MKDVTTVVGQRAEQAAAEHLVRLGYEILGRNYRRPHCEIDIIASRDARIHFVEVKYRSRSDWGSGLAYITARKLQHMERAALTWIRDYQWNGEYALSAIEVGGPDYEVQELIESITP
jgi:putative endonuclease